MLARKPRQRGLSLIESMIALVVISVGLLGIASLQLTAMGQNTSALNHSQAVWYAYNMADRIRANDAAQFANYDGIDTDTGGSGDCISSACSPGQMIQADAAEWTTMVQSLPDGRGMVDATADGLRIRVMWDDEGTGAAGTNCDVNVTCYNLVVSPPVVTP